MNGLFRLMLGWLRPLLNRLGADTELVIAIVSLKLTLDNRRNSSVFSQYRQQKESNSALWLSLAMYFLFGGMGAAMLGAGLRSADTALFGFSFAFAIPMLMVGMALTSDFSAVLLDSSDNAIILPRPVSSRTLLIARLVHIGLYLTLMATASAGISVAVVWFMVGGLMAVSFYVLVLLATLLMVFLTSLLYLVLMRFLSEERLRSAITYLQIIIAIVFYAGYQVLPRMINFSSDGVMAADVQWWHYLLPPVWLGGTMELLTFHTADLTHLVLLGLAVLTPFAGLWITTPYLAPLYNQRMATLDTDNRAPQADKTSQQQGASPFADRLAGWVCQSMGERAGFGLTWRTMLRDRQFKLRAYPGIGYMVVLFAVSIWRADTDPANFLTSNSGGAVFVLYFSSLAIGSALSLIWYSDLAPAAWVYVAAPLARPGEVLLGAIKATLIQFLLPALVIVGAILFYFGGWAMLDDVLLALLINILFALLNSTVTGYRLPFSLPSSQMGKGANVGRSFLILLLISLLGGLHWGLTFIPYGVWAGIPVAAVAVVLYMRYMRNTDWKLFRLA